MNKNMGIKSFYNSTRKAILKVTSSRALLLALCLVALAASSCFADDPVLDSWKTAGDSFMDKTTGMIWFFRILGTLMVVFAFITGAMKWMFAGERGGDEKNKLIIVAVAGFIIILAPTIVSLILKALGMAGITDGIS